MSADVKPAVPTVYDVEVMVLDPVTQAPLGPVLRFARWTGLRWCCWGISREKAAMCDWPGPLGGYRWRWTRAA